MTKHHHVLGIYQKKHLKKFINYKNETQNHINSNYLSKNPQILQFVDFFYILKPHFIEKKSLKKQFCSNQARIKLESASKNGYFFRTKLELDSTLIRLWLPLNS